MGLWRDLLRRSRAGVYRLRRLARRRLRPAVGDAGETAALRWLLRLGMDVVGRRVRIAGGELDLVAYDGGTVVFVEVKTRSRRDRFPPQLAVDPRKQAQLVRLGQAFCHRHGLDGCPVRFDVMAVTLQGKGRPEIKHFVRAF